MKEYMKPVVEVINFTTEAITAELGGVSTSNPGEDA